MRFTQSTLFGTAQAVLTIMSFSAVATSQASAQTGAIGPHVFPSDNVRQEQAVDKQAVSQPLVYHGGPLLTSPKLVDVFWGSGWNQDVGTEIALQLESIQIAQSTDPIMAMIESSYSTSGNSIGTGQLTKSFYESTPPIPLLPDQLIRSFLQSWIATQQVPAPDPHTLYNIYTEPGVCVILPDGTSSCPGVGKQAFCGYHSYFPYQGQNVIYAVVPYANVSGCNSKGTTNSETLVASHEIYEVITDPLGNAWFDSSGNEIGDKCNWQATTEFGMTVQKAWFNGASACFPL